MNLNKLHKWAYVVMAVLTLILLIAVIAVSAGASNEVLKGPLVITIFGVYCVLQIACIVFMKPKLSVYRIGFYALHIGIVVLLLGFGIYEAFGESIYSNVPVNSAGYGYDRIQREDGSFAELGFGIKLNNFTVEKYESGSPKQYIANLGIYEESGNNPGSMYNSENALLKVNDTHRKNGWKIFLMSYDDGSAYLPQVAPSDEYSSTGGAEAVLYEIKNSGKYEGAEVYYYLYNMQSGSYSSLGSDASALSQVQGLCNARVYQGEGGYYVYISQTYVQLLFKKDPGEFVVLTGIIMTILGVILMCIIRGKKANTVGDEGGDAQSIKGADAKTAKTAKTVKKGSGSK